MKKKPTGYLCVFLGILIFSVNSYALTSKCISVIDGDTIILDNGEHVRLIGVDTPEKSHPLKPIEYFSEEATQFTQQMAEGKDITLEFDAERRGKYGRLLAYVYLLNGTFVNAEIIKQGYGFAYTKYPFKYKDLFVSLENEAKKNKCGYWKYGGKEELNWVLKRSRRPFLIYPMSQNLWGIKYNIFIKTRLNGEELVAVLNNLKVWIYEYHEDDLKKQLLNSGWERGDKK